MFPQGGWGERAPAPTGQAPHVAILGKGSHGEIRVQVRGYRVSHQLLVGTVPLYTVFVLKTLSCFKTSCIFTVRKQTSVLAFLILWLVE